MLQVARAGKKAKCKITFTASFNHRWQWFHCERLPRTSNDKAAVPVQHSKWTLTVAVERGFLTPFKVLCLSQMTFCFGWVRNATAARVQIVKTASTALYMQRKNAKTVWMLFIWASSTGCSISFITLYMKLLTWFKVSSRLGNNGMNFLHQFWLQEMCSN